MYNIQITSNYAELYRYNILATCAGYDVSGEQIYNVSAECVYKEEVTTDITAKPEIPADFKVGRPLVLECEEAKSISVVVYVVTNTLPEDRIIENSPPFPLNIVVEQLGDVIYDTLFNVNQWGGETIKINL